MRLIKAAALTLAAALSLAATPDNWASRVASGQPGSHVMGNPAAKVKLIEYVSYTCPHCAHFQIESEATLARYYVGPGRVSVEVRHLIRDSVDLTAALLANCGEPRKFFALHNAFLKGQDKWVAAMDKANAAQKQRWSAGDVATRRRALAGDLGFYAIMERNGIGRSAADRCLADEAVARRLAGQTQEAVRQGVEGTPTFAINDAILKNVHDWSSLEAQLKARL